MGVVNVFNVGEASLTQSDLSDLALSLYRVSLFYCLSYGRFIIRYTYQQYINTLMLVSRALEILRYRLSLERYWNGFSKWIDL